MNAKSDQQDVQWTRRRRPVRPAPSAARKLEGPRFDRFTAAMNEARAAGAPQTLLYCDPGPSVRPAAAPWVARCPSAGPSRRRLLPAFGGRGFVPGRVTLRWVGLAGCILMFSVLLAHWAIRTNVAATAQLFGAQVGDLLRGPTDPVERQADRSPLAPDARADDLSPPPATPPTAEALLTQATELLPSAEQPPGTTTPTASGPRDPRVRFPPLPLFKPTAAID